MKPFPPELQAAYPCAPDRLPDRPWWRRVATKWDVEFRFLRSDGKYATVIDSVAEVDKAHPLPHPGFRVGQVWAAAKEGRISVQMIAEQSDEDLIVGGLCLSKSKAEYTSQFWVNDWLNGFFLLADPACPHLAPWAPV